MTRGRLSRRAASRLLVWCAVCGAMWLCGAATANLNAQDPRPAPAAAPDAAATDAAAAPGKPTLGLLIVQSNMLSLAFYAVLLIFSVVAATVAFERLVNLRRSRVLPAGFADGLRDLLQRGADTETGFRQLCETTSAPVSKILKAGVLRAGRPLPEVEKAMEDAAMREMAAMRSRAKPLNVVGSIAPLVGLLGTVVGMIFAFGEASEQGLGKAESLAHGIYLALMTTAGGLTIAIPALLCAAWFQASAERLMRDIDECLLDTMPSFARLERPPASLAPHESSAVKQPESLVAGGRPR